MSQKKIVYAGLCCHVNSKAAFIEKCVEESEAARMALLDGVMESGEQELFFGTRESRGAVACRTVVWGIEEQERIFDKVIGRKLLNKRSQLPASLEFYSRPLIEMNHKDIRVESLGFLTYAIVKNERCMEAVRLYTEKEPEIFYEAYKQEEDHLLPLMSWFLQADKPLAKAAAGLLLLVRREEEEGEWYKVLMDILYSGYKPLKNSIKKLHCFTGENFRDFMDDERDMVENLSRMMVQMVIAEDIGVPIKNDYFFYVVVQMFQFYESDLIGEFLEAECTKEGEARYKQMQKLNPHLNSYYDTSYLSVPITDEEVQSQFDAICGHVAATGEKHSVASHMPMELLFSHYHLNLRMLSGLGLEKKEAELLFSLFGKMSQNKYEDILLIATLCKYIQGLQQICEANQAAEIAYQDGSAREECRKLSLDMKQLKERARVLEHRLQEQAGRLKEQETRNDKLKKTLQEKDEQHRREKEELIGLRNFVFQLNDGQNDGRKETAPEAEWGRKLKAMQKEKLLVIGGHENWQKKMKRQFPNGQFLSACNKNFDVSMLRNKKYIIVNTDILKHASYYRIMADRQSGQKILYVHGNNIDRCLEELGRQV